MATLVSKAPSFPELGISEQEQDPNSLLLELDRGLKSSQIGEQCESISRFLSLFEKYPFPVLINSALLKLADVFRQEAPGSNFVRVCVVEVIERGGKHLDKLINVEEFIRGIMAVMHSNDPMARALTLRTLGWMSVVVGENRQVHHLIREALDAKDSVELQAAIFAAGKYAAESKTFAMNMCDRLTSMICGLATPVDVKLQLIEIFQHMHHDVETATTVRELCLKLLKEYPTQRVMITTLHTLTKLASHSLVDIPKQVDLLLDTLESEARLGVRRAILGELNALSKAAPRAWTSKNLKALVLFAQKSIPNTGVVCISLEILSHLVASIEFSHGDKETELAVLDLGRRCMNDVDVKIASNGLQLFTNITLIVEEKEAKLNLVEEAVDATLGLVPCIVASSSQPKLNSCLSLCLKCVRALSRENDAICPQVFPVLLDILNNKSLSDRNARLICEALTSLGAAHSAALLSCIDQLILILHKMAARTPLDPQQTELMVCLATLLLQTFHCHEWLRAAEEALNSASKSVNRWAAYKIARQASRYGHHSIGHWIYNELSLRVSSDQQHFWLLALSEMSRGEQMVTSEGDRADNLLAGNFFLLRSVSSLKAASSLSNPLSFPLEYISLRAEALICHAQLMHACLSLRTAPPPAIAASIVSSSSGRDDLLRCGRVSQQLNKSLKDFAQLSVKFGKLYQSSFDADPLTLRNISLLQESANLIAKSIELIVRPNTTGSVASQFTETELNGHGTKSEVIELESLAKSVSEAAKLSVKLTRVCSEVKPIREQHLHVLLDISKVLTSVPHPYPRFFFQSLQQTTITLNLSPQPTTITDPLSVMTTGQLAIKVEGVIVHGRHLGLFRNVQTVTLTLASVIQNRPAHTLDLKIEPNETLSQTVRPHNDFFTAHFLLGFPIPGMYQVTVEASVTDTDDDAWQTGPAVSQIIKALEDPNAKVPATQIRAAQIPSGQYGIQAGQRPPAPVSTGVPVDTFAPGPSYQMVQFTRPVL